MSTIADPANDGDDATRDELIARFDGLAVSLARRYGRRRGLDEDFLQVARLGLVLAARRYDAARGAFGPYAAATVRGELRRHLRDHAWNVRVPRQLQEDALDVAAATDHLMATGGAEPTTADVAEQTGLSCARVREASQARAARVGVELDPTTLGATCDPVDELAILRAAMRDLPDGARRILAMRFGADLTQNEIGRRIGVSQPQVHRRLRVALSDLERRLEDAA